MTEDTIMCTFCKLHLRTRIPAYGWISAAAMAMYSLGTAFAHVRIGVPSGAIYASLSAAIF